MSATEGPPTRETRTDFLQQPVSALLWWCLPLAAGFAASLFAIPPRAAALVWTIAFIWMGTGCVLNAQRCHRLHCYISGPVFFLGAVATGLLLSGALTLSQRALNDIVGFTLIAALLSFVPERIWRKYA
ncbi:MAG: hypothetical protein JSR60_07635 [Proteobacteria bacterium]|nr:hypothetical protein [Pseudomonadota bacterium]